MNEHDKLLISAYVDGALSPEDAVRAKQLLAGNPACRAYYDDIRKLSISLSVVKDEQLSPDAEIQIIQRLHKETTYMKPKTWKTAATVCVILIITALALQTYAKRGIQGRLKQATNDIGDQYSAKPKSDGRLRDRNVKRPDNTGSTLQYDAYYTNTSVLTDKSSTRRASGYVDATVYSSGLMRDTRVIGTDVNNDSWGGESPAVTQKAKHEINDQYAMASAANYKGFLNKSPIPDQYQYNIPSNTEEYPFFNENEFLTTDQNPLSTFSTDVDTASYSNLRRYLTQNQVPPQDAVRLEEMINYFSYNYPNPKNGEPFSITTDLAVCPWAKKHLLLRIGLKGRVPDEEKLPASNLVFLIDVSGSMQDNNKLPLLKEGFKMMVRQLRPEDRVSIVVYAGYAGKVLDTTSGYDKEAILSAIDNLQAGGSTAGNEGIQLAYRTARESFIRGGNNRVILATDGDFNVGISDIGLLTNMIEEKRQEGVFLTILGVGNGNYKDDRLQSLADKGNGNYFYLDSIREAQKVLVHELGSTLFTIAKDVKIQVEFNPSQVKAYRLLGYEKRVMAKQDFNNDAKDAGEIGAGHTVTALYELVPPGVNDVPVSVDELKYSRTQPSFGEEVLTVKLRYKEPDGNVSKLITKPVGKGWLQMEPSGDFAWAAAVAEFGMLVKDSASRSKASFDHVLKATKSAKGDDRSGQRQEFIDMVETAQNLVPENSGQINFKGGNQDERWGY
ncbi:MAG: von Willebrand factor type A domain-containing protein [Candidatus Omnitrophota bacterium]